MQDFRGGEDSRSIKQYFQPTKAEKMKEKRQTKQIEQKKVRKKSAQLSIFGWLLKDRPKQNCAITTLPKNLVLNIYSFLRVSEIMMASQCCYYFYDSAKTIWHDSDFFSELQTDKLTHTELSKIIQKGSTLQHIKQLRSIYRGKNIKSCRQKIKLKIHNSTNHSMRPVSGNLLEVFEVAPKNKKGIVFLMDSHLQQIINSSFRSLISIKLESCLYIRKMYNISRCQQLTTLHLTLNSYLSSEDMRAICKGCTKLNDLNLSGCDGLDQEIFRHISKLQNLRLLSLNNYRQSFGDLQCLRNLVNIKEIHLENSCIIDSQALQIIKQLPSLSVLNLGGCRLLTDYLVENLMASSMRNNRKLEVELSRTSLSKGALQQFADYCRNLI